MFKNGLYACVCVFLVLFKRCGSQVLQFGTCVEVETMRFFNLEKFLGNWYEIERFPTWYNSYNRCAYKHIEACGRRIEIEHGFIRDEVKFVLHVNSTYVPGDEAVFFIHENNIDPIGIPLSVILTDYTNYAVVYGCKHNLDMNIKYLSAWILGRERSLPPDVLKQAYAILNSIPYANTAYLKVVEQSEEKCGYLWTAHVQAEELKEN